MLHLIFHWLFKPAERFVPPPGDGMPTGVYFLWRHGKVVEVSQEPMRGDCSFLSYPPEKVDEMAERWIVRLMPELNMAR